MQVTSGRTLDLTNASRLCWLRGRRPLDSARQLEPPALVLNEVSCYYFRAFDPRLPLSDYRQGLSHGFLQERSPSLCRASSPIPPG